MEREERINLLPKKEKFVELGPRIAISSEMLKPDYPFRFNIDSVLLRNLINEDFGLTTQEVSAISIKFSDKPSSLLDDLAKEQKRSKKSSLNTLGSCAHYGTQKVIRIFPGTILDHYSSLTPSELNFVMTRTLIHELQHARDFIKIFPNGARRLSGQTLNRLEFSADSKEYELLNPRSSTLDDWLSVMHIESDKEKVENVPGILLIPYLVSTLITKHPAF